MTARAKPADTRAEGTGPLAFAGRTGSAAQAPVISIRDLKAHCRSCSIRELCLPFGLDAEDVRRIDALVGSRVRLKRGEALYRADEAFKALFAVRLGSLKTTMLAEDGREQIVGFHMLGDVIGLDGMGTARHACQAIALEDAEICVLPFDRIEEFARAVPKFQHHLHQFLSREISRDQNLMLLLGSMHAEERLAVFLLSLGERYRRRGYSSTEFVLRMTREEIGSHLGLKLETVSRLFSRFQEDGLIQVRARSVKLLKPAALRELVGRHN